MKFGRGRRWVLPALFVLGFTYLLLGMFQPLEPFDEGFILVGAERIAHGAVPYRDFAAYYTPGQFYTIAAVFHVFGSSILVERVWDTLVRFGLCVLVLVLARAAGEENAAYAPSFVMLLFLGWIGFYSYPVIPAMVFALAAILILVLNWPANRLPGVFLGGLAAGISVLYRQDVGAFICASGAAALLLPPPGENWVPRGRPVVAKRLKPVLFYALGACAVLLPSLFYFLRAETAGNLWSTFIVLPRLQLQFRRLPLPPLVPGLEYLYASMLLEKSWFLLYTPVAVFLAFSLKALHRVLRSPEKLGMDRRGFAFALLTLFGALLLITTLTRADPVHCLAPLVPAVILGVALLKDLPRRRIWGPIAYVGLVSALVLPFCVIPVFRLAVNLKNCPPWTSTSSLPRARFFHVPSDQEQAILYIQNEVPKGDPIFVGNSQHRQVFANDAMFYFLAGRTPGTKYEEFEPGVVTTARVQQAMVQGLKENHVRWIVLFSGFESFIRENSSHASGAGVLDSFIRRKYKKVDRFGRYSILEKHVGPGPAMLPPGHFSRGRPANVRP